ncbi:Nitrate reductase [NADPH] [Hypsizygus marmoreus]|uniref:Nitrate reductase n=1 Tax=Hypsizygus marmoreus TaxID=39966 RepID=A0A369KD47_HYPMA|nr:Nitrate reductase [NADPH] [Hypsizygus marmoreus]
MDIEPFKDFVQCTAESQASIVAKEGGGPLLLPSSLPTLPHEGVTMVQDIDLGTPDSWVKRDNRIIRLTGKHPLNCEPPLTTLFNTGFLTPAPLFFVRSHGAVPSVENATSDAWTMRVCGLVSKPTTFSIADLKKIFQVVTLPVTLVCAGNRRMEQNVVRKGLGFNWGAGGLSTALFTGVYLSDILEYVNPTSSADGRKPRHVVFEGIDQLPQGPYGTSQRLSWAKNKGKGMLICWAMNGLPLTPDHGFPLRLVVPGQIGGRSVKWLHKIEVSDRESQHYLHAWDNKLLPTEVSASQARAEAHWWYNPKYTINDLNVNSAIVHPAHEEILSPSRDSYLVEGYAYSGGGKRVTRVEISFDEGNTWALCQINYPEDLYREVAFDSTVFGRLDLTDREECFCWCFWSFSVDVNTLRENSSIQIRAMDEGLALQQRDMYWNATSMMNNWWFRVAIHTEPGGALRFEHPTDPANARVGWMQRMKDEGYDILNPVFTQAKPTPSPTIVQEATPLMTNPKIAREITLEELQAHSGAKEPWFVVNGEVYDGTGYLNDHPGGAHSITGMAGQDASEDFMAIHSITAQAQLAQFHIGRLNASVPKPEIVSSPDDAFLSKTQWKKVVLVSTSVVTHNSRFYRFALERDDQLLGLPIGQHIFVRMRRASELGTNDGELVQRAYTPVSPPGSKGFLELLVKLYLPDERHPAGGKMSCLFDRLRVGESVEVKGPVGSFTWMGRGIASWKGAERNVKNIAMIGGGSGITPMLQVLRGILSDGEDTQTAIWLLYANRTENDILCRDDLENMLKTAGGRYQVQYTLSAPPAEWKYSQGRINTEMLRRHLPPFREDSLALVCGPGGLISACKDSLRDMGWDITTQLVVF